MMYPRLALLHDFLSQNGVILVSIDDAEMTYLRIFMDDVFGRENFIAQLIWKKGRKNDAKLFSIGHEYIVVYAKSISRLRQKNVIWREEKPGAKEIHNEYILTRKTAMELFTQAQHSQPLAECHALRRCRSAFHLYYL